MADDDGFRRLLSTLRRLKLVRTNVTMQPLPLPRQRRRVAQRTRASVHDRPRAHLPVLTHALRQRKQIRWSARCFTGSSTPLVCTAASWK